LSLFSLANILNDAIDSLQAERELIAREKAQDREEAQYINDIVSFC
jgi:hypothetical protein